MTDKAVSIPSIANRNRGCASVESWAKPSNTASVKRYSSCIVRSVITLTPTTMGATRCSGVAVLERASAGVPGCHLVVRLRVRSSAAPPPVVAALPR